MPGTIFLGIGGRAIEGQGAMEELTNLFSWGGGGGGSIVGHLDIVHYIQDTTTDLDSTCVPCVW